MSSVSTVSQEQRILEVARELFTQRGFSNVAMRDICKAANVTPPTVYYYFKNKEALFNAVVRETITMKEFISRLDESRKAKDSDSQIRRFTETYLSYFPRERLNVGLYLRRSTELDSVSKKSLTAELARVQDILIILIKDGIEKGKLRKTDPRMAAECLIGMIHRFVFQRIHFQRNYNATEATTYLTDFFLRAMAPTQ